MIRAVGLFALISSGLVIGLLVFGAILMDNTSKPETEWREVNGQRVLVRKPTGAELRADELQRIRENATLSNLNWRAGGFGTVMIASFTVANKNQFSIKDIRVECRVFGKSGTQIGSPANTLFDSVPAGKNKRFTDFSVGSISGQAASASCEIMRAERG